MAGSPTIALSWAPIATPELRVAAHARRAHLRFARPLASSSRSLPCIVP